MDALISLLGKPIDSEAAKSWLETNGPWEATVFDWSDEGEPLVHHLECKQNGLTVTHSENGEIDTIFLMGGGVDGYSQYRGDLGHGLSFASSPEDVARALGSPSFSREPQTGFFNERIGKIIRFDYPKHSIHFQFNEDSPGLKQVTLMTAASTPGRKDVG